MPFYTLFRKHSSVLNFVFLIVLFAGILNSCYTPKSKLSKYGNVIEEVIRTDSGVFRGFNLGDNFKLIQISEKNNAIEQDSNYLYYEFKVDNVASYNITYNFDENGLNEIQSEIYVIDASKTDDVYSNFKHYFDEYFGASENHMGYLVWTISSSKFDKIRINLSDESADFTVDKAPVKLSLWIYTDKN